MTGKPERWKEFNLRELRAIIAALETLHDPDHEPQDELAAIVASLTAECRRAIERRRRLAAGRGGSSTPGTA